MSIFRTIVRANAKVEIFGPNAVSKLEMPTLKSRRCSDACVYRMVNHKVKKINPFMGSEQKYFIDGEAAA